MSRLKLKKYIAFRLFLLISGTATLVEPALVGSGASIQVQVIVLAVSTAFYLALLILVFLNIDRSVGPILQRVMCIFDSEVVFETVWFIFGWSCIFEYPGLAALRLCRAFRVLWFVELIANQEEFDPEYKPEEHLVSVAKICSLGVQYMESIGCELFTAKSKGGVVLLIIFFYVTYVFAMVFWIEDRNLVTPNDTSPITGNNTVCGTLMGCTITLMRLSFYDGTGFDYLSEVIASRSPILTGLLIFYMVFTAMILLNGLIGIFGSAFAASREGDAAAEEPPYWPEPAAGVDDAETRRLVRRLDDLRRSTRAFFGECAADLDTLRTRVTFAHASVGDDVGPPRDSADSPAADAPRGPAPAIAAGPIEQPIRRQRRPPPPPPDPAPQRQPFFVSGGGGPADSMGQARIVGEKRLPRRELNSTPSAAAVQALLASRKLAQAEPPRSGKTKPSPKAPRKQQPPTPPQPPPPPHAASSTDSEVSPPSSSARPAAEAAARQDPRSEPARDGPTGPSTEQAGSEGAPALAPATGHSGIGSTGRISPPAPNPPSAAAASRLAEPPPTVESVPPATPLRPGMLARLAAGGGGGGGFGSLGRRGPRGGAVTYEYAL